MTEAQTCGAELYHPLMARWSPQGRAATEAVVAWGRQRYPGARVILELKVGGCRLDVAFILPAHLIGVEIKSERDTLARLSEQLRQFCREIPEVWVAAAERWAPKIADLPSRVGRLCLRDGAVDERIPIREGLSFPHSARTDAMLTAPMLNLLWRAEAMALASRHGVEVPSRMPLHQLVKVLARRLTGDAIVEGVCAALRLRTIHQAADAPIPTADPAARTALAQTQAPSDGGGDA